MYYCRMQEPTSSVPLSVPAFGPTSSALGPHPVGTFDARHLCNGTSFSSATVYHPASGGGSQLPSVVLVGGYACGEQVMAAWAPFYASHGIVAMTIGTCAPFRDKPPDRSRALVDASAALQGEHHRAGSALEGRLDASRRAVQGYSLGGGAVQLAALADPTLRCAIAISPHAGVPPSLPDELTASVPMLFLVGERDREAPSQAHSWPQYYRTAAPKLIFEVAGGDHFVANGPSGGIKADIASNGAPCFFCQMCCVHCCGGLSPCPCAVLNGPSGHAQEQAAFGPVGGVALAWLKLFLMDDEGALRQLLHSVRPAIASGFESKGVDLVRLHAGGVVGGNMAMSRT